MVLGLYNHSGRIQYTYVFSLNTIDNSSVNGEQEINKRKKEVTFKITSYILKGIQNIDCMPNTCSYVPHCTNDHRCQQYCF